MNPKKNIFDYNSAIEKLPEEWMSDMAIVFREFDEDEDGKISISTARHIFDIFRLPAKDAFKECEFVTFKRFLDEAGIQRDTIFLNSRKRYAYYFQMIAGIGSKSINAVDIQHFMAVNGDNIASRFCEDFIDEFDRKHLSKDSISLEEFCAFCSQKKIPI